MILLESISRLLSWCVNQLLMPHKTIQNSKQASTFNISIKFNLSDGSPEPFTLDLFGIAPFPIWVQTGALVTVAAQITLEEVIDVGAKVSFNIVMEGLIPIPIPCLDLSDLGVDTSIGSW